MSINAGMMTSNTDQWATPQAFFDECDKEFGPFTLDVCAGLDNAKVWRFFDKDMDGLSRKWEGVCWMNPPYGKGIGDWMRKAYDSHKNGAVVVCLVPARTDTAWWHDYAMKGEVRFIRGRLKFGDAKIQHLFHQHS